jgi:hypothetical protein
MKRPISRIDAIKSLTALPVVALGVAAALSGAKAATAPTNNRAQFKYQDTPKNGQACAACRFYVPNKKPKLNGTCTVVSGSINPKGWCVAFAKK